MSSGQGQGYRSKNGFKKSLIPQCKTSIGINSGSMKHRATQHGVFEYGGWNSVIAIFVT